MSVSEGENSQTASLAGSGMCVASHLIDHEVPEWELLKESTPCASLSSPCGPARQLRKLTAKCTLDFNALHAARMRGGRGGERARAAVVNAGGAMRSSTERTLRASTTAEQRTVRHTYACLPPSFTMHSQMRCRDSASQCELVRTSRRTSWSCATLSCSCTPCLGSLISP